MNDYYKLGNRKCANCKYMSTAASERLTIGATNIAVGKKRILTCLNAKAKRMGWCCENNDGNCPHFALDPKLDDYR